MSESNLLIAKKIEKKFGENIVLNGIDFELNEGSVHALCGGNGAGKSTFLKIIMGLEKKDSGEIIVNGENVNFTNAQHAINCGVAIITQELEPIPYMPIYENIFLGREQKKYFIVNKSYMIKEASKYLSELGLNLDPRMLMKDLSLAQMQLVEIAKALSQNANILIMDEPTSAIGEKESEVLFSLIRKLKSKGVGIIYVSHRMNEIYAIADTYSVFRDGKLLSSGKIDSITPGEMVEMIVGKSIQSDWSRPHSLKNDDVALSVRNITLKNKFRDISFDLNKGEVFGIFGLMGAGRSELLHSIFGLDVLSSGKIQVGGHVAKIRTPMDAISLGIALVTEDRKLTGLDLTKSVKENITIANIKNISKNWIINQIKEDRVASGFVSKLSIKTDGIDIGVKSLSGGNQQKVVFSKWINTSPSILLLDEPTRGVDVGAKSEIYELINDFVSAGNSVIMVSSEIPEVMGMSDRIMVLRKGECVGIVERSEFSQEKLAHLAS